MGRLQRKKTAVKKKSIKTDDSTSLEVQASGNTTSAQGTLSSGVTREAARKQPVRKKPSSIVKPPAAKSNKNYLNQGMQFLREVKVELKKVTWPTRKQTIGSTAVVILLVMIISMFLGVVDIGLSSLIRIILH